VSEHPYASSIRNAARFEAEDKIEQFHIDPVLAPKLPLSGKAWSFR
jgi:hypothetical protein